MIRSNGLNGKIVLGLAAGLMLAAVTGCPQRPAGHETGRPAVGAIFRHRWWNYYARALESADRQEFDAARKDLLTAMAQRDKDQPMARTYGMHFIDYFPHRELGVIFWLTDRPSAAEKELQRSITQYPSAKARYYLDQIVVSGDVRDQTEVVKLTINGDAALPKGGDAVIFSHFLPLKTGKNRITFTAEDRAGNQSTKTLRILRKESGRFIKERLCLSVLEFDCNTQKPGSHHTIHFQDNLIHHLTGRDRFNLVDRKQIEEILTELKLSRSDLFDRKTALELGKLSSAQAVVAGSLVESRIGVEIKARVIDVERSEIIATADAYGEEKGYLGIDNLARILSLKIHRKFPLVQDRVVSKRDHLIFTDLGSEKIGAQRHIIVYRPRPVVDAATVLNLGEEAEFTAAGRLVQCDPKFSKVEVPAGRADAIGPRHKVITR